MTLLREKAAELLRIAQAIQAEDFYNDVTSEEQQRLEEIVKTIQVTANLVLLHLKHARPSQRRVVGARPKTKLRVVK